MSPNHLTTPAYPFAKAPSSLHKNTSSAAQAQTYIPAYRPKHPPSPKHTAHICATPCPSRSVSPPLLNTS